MSPLVGLGVDAAGQNHLPTIQASGATAVRVPLLWERQGHSFDPGANVRRFHDAGIQVLGLFIPESLWFGGDPMPLAEAATRMAQACARWCMAVEIGNEPDDPGGSSSTMSRTEFSDWLNTAGPIWRAYNPAIEIVSGGLSSGQPAWLRGVDLRQADACGVHLYDERPMPTWPSPAWGNGYAPTLLDGYVLAAQGRPLWITEWGTTDQALQAEYLTRSLPAYASHAAVDAAFYFQYDDSVPPFGLFDGSNQPKPAWAAFQATAKHLAPPLPTPGGIPHMASMDDLYKAVWTAGGTSVPYNPAAAICKHWLDLTRSGDPIGIPVTNEIDVGSGHTGQGFSSGRRLIWQGGDQVAEG